MQQLDGGGAITLDGYGDEITSASHSFNSFDNFDNNSSSHSFSVLDNVDNTISGAGFIGGDDLRLDNENNGTIDADRKYETLTIDTGHHEIINTGTLEASHGGILDVDSSVKYFRGLIQVDAGSTADFADSVCGGKATIEAGGTLDIWRHVERRHNVRERPVRTYSELVLKDPTLDFYGKRIFGFTGTGGDDPSLANSDEIDLAGINFNSRHFRESYNSETGVLKVTDGTHTYAELTFVDFTGTFQFDNRRERGNSHLRSMPAKGSSTVSVGGPGNDNFVFQPGIGADTLANFNPHVDTIQLENFANVQNAQQLAALITADAHGDAVIDLGHHDSITLPGVTTSYLQSHLQSLVHLGV